MFHPLHRSSVGSDYGNTMVEMVRLTFRDFILMVCGGIFTWFIVATATWPGTYDWQARGFMFLLIGICGLSIWLLPKQPVLAKLTWQVGMIAAITWGVWLFHRPELALLYILLPLVAVIAAGWPASLLVQGVIAAAVIWLSHDTMANVLPGEHTALIIIAGVCTSLLGSAMMQKLFTAMEWYVFALAHAEENLESVRLHRAQLMRMQKTLDEAYYRLKRANSALTAAWKAADEAESFKAEFVTNVSHELRTPLNLVVGFSEVMMTSPESYGNTQLPGAYRRDLNSIYHSAQHLLALVDDVLDLARIEVGKIVLTRDEVDLAALLAETTEIVRDYVAAKGLEFQINVADNLPFLWIDRLRIRQVLLNLLVNAARFTEQGSIRLDVTHLGEEVLVRVKDSGRGIPASDLPKIFEEFRTTEQPFSAWHSGTGLGLPISKKFVELNGGRMGVESAHMQGASFWFTLPSKPTAQPNTSARGKRLKPLMTPPERIIVVVHEDSRVASLLQRHLDGYQVLSASNVQDGIAIAETVQAIALVIDDAQPLPTLPNDTLTIRCSLPNGYQAARSLGADNLLVKPVTHQQLLAAISQLACPIQRILIVDDDPEMVRVFQRMLFAHFPIHACLEAYNGEEAIRLMQAEKPDLVLLDLVMPGQDGHSVLRQMAKDPVLSTIPVIVISAKGQDYLNSPLPGSFQISKANGFQFGEIVQMLDTTFKALAGGWYLPESNEPKRVEAFVGSRV